MTLCNINYHARLLETVDHLPFRLQPPYMYVHDCEKFKIIIFKSGKCRIMGCHEPLTKLDDLPFKLQITRIMSVTVKFTTPKPINLNNLGMYCYHEKLKYIFEPELFPALRLAMYNPLCVNVFASGKCIILGIKHLCFQKYIRTIQRLINASGAMYSSS